MAKPITSNQCVTCGEKFNAYQDNLTLRVAKLKLKFIRRTPLCCLGCSRKEYREMIKEYCADLFTKSEEDIGGFEVNWKKCADWYYNFREGQTFSSQRRDSAMKLLIALGVISRDPLCNWEAFRGRLQSINPGFNGEPLFFTRLKDACAWTEAYYREHYHYGEQTCAIRQCGYVMVHDFHVFAKSAH